MAKAKVPNAKDTAWPLYDEIVDSAPAKTINPWSVVDGALAFSPDYETLTKLMEVPLSIPGANSRSGVPALALDVWVAYELRRAGLDPDCVWPRASPPRVLPVEIARLIDDLPGKLAAEVGQRLVEGRHSGVAPASANVLGKNYLKQVDVVISRWQTGPELMISTKRMDSSFSNNAANRVEESYGDAKNLRLRHPQAACGFVYSLRSTCWTEAPDKAAWLVDLLAKLGREDDAYNACALIVPEWDGVVESADEEPPAPIDLDETTEESVVEQATPPSPSRTVGPSVGLRHDLIPLELSPERFFRVMVETVLTNSPINMHEGARIMRRDAQG